MDDYRSQLNYTEFNNNANAHAIARASGTFEQRIFLKNRL